MRQARRPSVRSLSSARSLSCGVPISRSLLVALPLEVEIKAHRNDVGSLLAVRRRAVAGHWVDPVEHRADAIRPVPVEAEREVVVLAAVELGERQV